MEVHFLPAAADSPRVMPEPPYPTEPIPNRNPEFLAVFSPSLAHSWRHASSQC